ncbi:unnamed protein product, partial [marine sediment metagenome]
LSEVTGYSRAYLSRVATGNQAPSEPFIALCCHNLKEPQEELFRLIELQKGSMRPAHPHTLTQDLLETVDELASQLTKAELRIKALEDELKQYS